MANETSDRIVELQNAFRTFLWIAAGVSTCLCVLFSGLLIRRHFHNLTRPREQRKIMGILWLAPIFAIDSFLSLSFPQVDSVFQVMKDVYEGYTVYLFFSLLVEYLGGPGKTVECLKSRLEPLYAPFPLNRGCCRRPVISEEDPGRFLFTSKRGVMQFVIVRPTTALIAFILSNVDLYSKGNFSPSQGFVYLETINNISVSWAAYCLVLFFLALKRPLAPHHPLPKFVAIKAIVFLCFWQEIVLIVLTKIHVIREIGSWTAENVTTGIADLLVCFEMLLAALYHRYAFPWQAYDRGQPTYVSVGLDNSFALSDATRDFSELFSSTPFSSKKVSAETPHVSTTTDTAQAIQVEEKDQASTTTTHPNDLIIDGGERHLHLVEKDGVVDIVLEGEEPLLHEH